MKRFLKESGGVDQYPSVRIEWIRHHTPELAIFRDGSKIQTIDLSGYNYNGLHELFSKHFARAGRALADADAGGSTPGGNIGSGGSSTATSAVAAAQGATSAAAAAVAALAGSLPASMSRASPFLRSPNDADLPQLVYDARQAADATVIAGLGQMPSYIALLAASSLCIALVARCVLRRRTVAGALKPASLDV